MARKTVTLNRFITRAADPYRALVGDFEKADHLDNLSRPGRLIPYSSPTAATSGQHKIGALKKAAYDGKLYGLGAGSSDAFPTVFNLDGPTSTSWSQRANRAASGSVQYPMFEEYHDAFYFWADSSGSIGKHDIAAPDAGDMASWQTVSLSPAAGPGHHFAPLDVLNMAYGNKIAQLADDTFTAAKLVLNPDHNVRSLTTWNDYECIGCNVLNDKVIVKFWDSVSDSVLFEREIPGQYLLALRNVGGLLVAITTPSSANVLRGRLYFHVLNGTEFEQILEHVYFEGTGATSSVIIPERSARVKNGQLYFLAGLNTGGAVTEYGLYRFGLNQGQYAFTKDRFATADNSETFGSDIGALDWFGDYAFIVHTDQGTITRSGGTGNPSALYRSCPLDFGSKTSRKKLVRVSVATSPLPAGETVTIKYSVDGGVFTELYTHSGTGSVLTTSTKSKGISSFANIRIQAEPTVGAEITEIAVTADDVADKYGTQD